MARLIFSLFFCLFALNLFGQSAEEYLPDGTKLTIEKCLELSAKKDQEGDKKEASRFLNQAASICWENKDYKKAIEYFEKSLVFNEAIGNENGIAMINNDLGMIYADEREYEKALQKFEQTLKVRRQKKEKIGIISALINISVVLNNLKRFNESAERLEDALKIATESSDIAQMKSCYAMLSETYEKARNTDKALYYFNLFKTFNNILERNKENKYLQDIEKSKLSAMLAEAEKRNKQLEVNDKNREIQEKDLEISKYSKEAEELAKNVTKQDLAISVLTKNNEIKTLKLKETEEKSKSERSFRNYLLFILLLVIAFVAYILINFFQKQKINKMLTSQNEEIMRQRKEIELKNDNLKKTLVEIKTLNEHLDEKVKERTEKLEIQNNQLRDYAFLNAHKLRAPLANILGLVNILQSDEAVDYEDELIAYLKISAEKLDTVVHEIQGALKNSNT